MKNILLPIACMNLLLLASCSSIPTSTYTVTKTSHLKMKAPAPLAGKTVSGQEIFLGGFSGLMLKEVLNKDELIFQTITDRGPNGYMNENLERPFLIPEFSPQIPTLKINLKENSFEVVDILKLKK
ncbi:MAG: hypothetical protein Q7U04_15810, partial [Bacteriovorax sp.]|nr:hypothetical protein [Bacteriovorax sp.]